MKSVSADNLARFLVRIREAFAAKGHGHPLATQLAAGFMSQSDKAKLDGVATGANKTVVDSSLSSSSANPVQNKAVHAALAGKAASSHTHSVLTIQVDGVTKATYNGGSAQTVNIEAGGGGDYLGDDEFVSFVTG